MLRCICLFLLCLALYGCAGIPLGAYRGMEYMPVQTDIYQIATWRKISDNKSPIRIYIEGDGRAFNAYGHPTRNPTPHNNLVRDMAARDTSANVLYIARPCQFILSPQCSVSDWTTGRFSSDITDSIASVIKNVAGNRPVILIGYSGGAMLSALIISKNPDLNIQQWITLAGVLNHAEWTQYFQDTPLYASLSLDELPHVRQCHYVADTDSVVPRSLSEKWTLGQKMIIVPGSTHSDFGLLVPDCVQYSGNE